MLTRYLYYLRSLGSLATGFRSLPGLVAIFLQARPQGVREVVLRKQGFRFLVRSRMDVWTIKETFLDRFYERYGFPIGCGWSVVDIGGGVGEFAVQAAAAYAGNRVFVYEPTPESYELLRKNLRLNAIENVETHAEAVWSDDQGVQLQTGIGEAVQYSTQRTTESARTPSVSLEQVVSRLPQCRCDLLKIDCEGAEYPLMYAASQKTFAHIDRIVMETHDRPGRDMNRDALAAFLRGKGFHVETFPNPVHADLGYLRAYKFSR